MSLTSVPVGADADATIPIALRRRPRAVVAPAADSAPVTHLRLTGRLDVHTVVDARLLLHDAIDRGSGDLVLDLSDAEIGDATGLGVLVGAHHRAGRAGRRLVLAGVSARLDRLLRASRLHRVLACAPFDVVPPSS